MKPAPLAFRPSPVPRLILIIVGLLPLAAGVGIGLFMKSLGIWAWFIPILTLRGVGLVLVLVGLLGQTDTEVKILVDENGITDQRTDSNSRTISWDSIKSMDCKIVNGSGELILYVSVEHGKIMTEKISISGLEGGPAHVGSEIKKFLLQLDVHLSTEQEPLGET